MAQTSVALDLVTRGRRRRLRAASVAGVLTALFLIIPMAATASSATRSSGFHFVDISLVRVRVPTDWVFTLAGDGCKQKSSCAGATLPGRDNSIDIAQVHPRGCTGTKNVNSIWVSRIVVQPHVATTVTKIACDSGVRVVDPSLGVTLYGFGGNGVAAAQSSKPSALADLLATHLTYSPLQASKRITYEHFTVDVPRAWPTVDLGRGHTANPGSCAFPPFPEPEAFTGWSGVVLHCPAITLDSSENAASAPGNGVWLLPVASKSYTATGPPATPPADVYFRQVGKVTVAISRPIRLTGSGSVDITLSLGKSRVLMELGLGANPKVAEEILDSVHSA